MSNNDDPFFCLPWSVPPSSPDPPAASTSRHSHTAPPVKSVRIKVEPDSPTPTRSKPSSSVKAKAKGKGYTVFQGINPGVYETWYVTIAFSSSRNKTDRNREEAKAETHGVSGNLHESFETLAIAQRMFDSALTEGKVKELGR